MKTEQLILSGDGYALAIAPEAEAIKAAILAAAGVVTVVNDASTSDLATAALKDLAAFRNTLEKSRKAVKEPVLKVGKDIDAKAAEFGEAVAAEETRIKKLVEAHAAEQFRKQQAAAREQARLVEEARQRQIAEELAKLEYEAIAAAKASEDAIQQAEFAAEMARIEKESAQDVAVAAVFSAPVIDAPKAKASLDYEVSDIAQFYNAFPQLCTAQTHPRRRGTGNPRLACRQKIHRSHTLKNRP
jgi:dGTP triphosphohydrolase